MLYSFLKILVLGSMVWILISFWYPKWAPWKMITTHEETLLLNDSSFTRHIILDDDGLIFDIKTHSVNLKDFFREQNIVLSEDDMVFPGLETTLYPGTHVVIQRSKHLTLTMENQKREIMTYQRSLDGVFAENNISLRENDLVMPGANESVFDDIRVTVIRVRRENQLVRKDIPYEKQVKEDSQLSWRKTIVTQKGENGIRELTYSVFFHDEKEVSRKLLSTEVAKDPIPEVVTQGTLVKVGKSHTGLGTWYAYTGTLSAASPWLPLGSYVKVTNQENGKNVIVKINDRGPFGKNRILDLDKVAFEKIASLGAGIINVKVEEIIN